MWRWGTHTCKDVLTWWSFHQWEPYQDITARIPQSFAKNINPFKQSFKPRASLALKCAETATGDFLTISFTAPCNPQVHVGCVWEKIGVEIVVTKINQDKGVLNVWILNRIWTSDVFWFLVRDFGWQTLVDTSGGLDEAIYYFKVGSINRRKWWSWTGSSHTNSHRSWIFVKIFWGILGPRPCFFEVSFFLVLWTWRDAVLNWLPKLSWSKLVSAVLLVVRWMIRWWSSGSSGRCW